MEEGEEAASLPGAGREGVKRGEAQCPRVRSAGVLPLTGLAPCQGLFPWPVGAGPPGTELLSTPQCPGRPPSSCISPQQLCIGACREGRGCRGGLGQGLFLCREAGAVHAHKCSLVVRGQAGEDTSQVGGWCLLSGKLKSREGSP